MSDIQALEKLKKDHQANVAMRDRVLRLSNNADFKAVIAREWMVEEVARFMDVAGNPNIKPEQRKDATDAALAPGSLKRWMHARIQMGDASEAQIIAIDEELEELRLEGEE